MPVTIRDVASASGVTIGTVSRALNGYPDVSSATRERVKRVAAELGYTPNQTAQSLSSKQRRNIGLFISGFLSEDVFNDFDVMLMRGAFQCASERGVNISLHLINSEVQEQKSFEQLCYEHGVSGAILFGLKTTDAYCTTLAGNTLPCVTIDIPVEGEHNGCVMLDDREAEAAATRFLLENGHRRIALVQGSETAAVSIARLAGVRDALREYGLELEPADIIHTDFTFDNAKRQVERFFAERGADAVTAFVCMSDLLAVGAMQIITHLGYRVPDDYSIVGYDGIALAAYTAPQLTTIDQQVRTKGYEAVNLLCDMLAGTRAAERVVLPHSLVERGSVRKIL